MTYCVGMILDDGLVFMADTRTNAGFDNVSIFKKCHTWSVPGERVVTLIAAGNLGTTQEVLALLDDRLTAAAERRSPMLAAPSMFQVASLVASTLHQVVSKYSDNTPLSDSPFSATFIVGGQVAGGAMRLFLIYPEGNFIEAGRDTPFFQIGEMKYGRPILIRAFRPEMNFEEALKVLLLSFDSTVRANLTVAPPFDFHFYKRDSLMLGETGRIDASDPYYSMLSQAWSDSLKTALEALPQRAEINSV